MSKKYTVLGFKPVTFRTCVTSNNHKTRAHFLFNDVEALPFGTKSWSRREKVLKQVLGLDKNPLLKVQLKYSESACPEVWTFYAWSILSYKYFTLVIYDSGV